MSPTEATLGGALYPSIVVLTVVREYDRSYRFNIFFPRHRFAVRSAILIHFLENFFKKQTNDIIYNIRFFVAYTNATNTIYIYTFNIAKRTCRLLLEILNRR